MTQKHPMLRMRQVSLIRQSHTILKEIDWLLPAGAVAVILGPNGSGKTSLIRTLCAYEWPTSGEIQLNGQTLGTVPTTQWRRNLANIDAAWIERFDHQVTAAQIVFSGLTDQLISYGQPDMQQQCDIDEALRQVGLEHMGPRIYRTLSSGEQRRCLLARALIRDPRLLILDEPTANLDVAAREQLLATLHLWRKNNLQSTLIMVTHHIEEIPPGTTHMLMLKAGRVHAAGPPTQVMTPEILSALLNCKVYVHQRSGRYWLEVLPEAWVDLLSKRRPFLAPDTPGESRNIT